MPRRCGRCCCSGSGWRIGSPSTASRTERFPPPQPATTTAQCHLRRHCPASRWDWPTSAPRLRRICSGSELQLASVSGLPLTASGLPGLPLIASELLGLPLTVSVQYVLKSIYQTEPIGGQSRAAGKSSRSHLDPISRGPFPLGPFPLSQCRHWRVDAAVPEALPRPNAQAGTNTIQTDARAFLQAHPRTRTLPTQ